MKAQISGTTRRHFLASSLFLLTRHALGATSTNQESTSHDNARVDYGRATLPSGIRSRRVATHNQILLHALEAGFESPERPCVVLLHGFPELAYTWRNQMLPLARAGYYVVAPDARGYGLSAAQPVAHDDSLVPYSMFNRVSDVLGLIRALGQEKVAMVVGHDWGGPTAQWCARLRPDVFRSVVSISTPFLGAPTLPLNTAARPADSRSEVDIDKELAALPRPRKRYFRYYASHEANEDMWHPPQGVHDLLRELFYFKSADWEGNEPFPLKSWTASELAKMPTYYIMDLNEGVAQTMAEHQPSSEYIAACRWMTEADLQVYATQFSRTGFQGGLNYYRVDYDEPLWNELNSFAGKTIDVPACYIGGANEWAVYQNPGAFQAMHTVCTQLKGTHLVPKAGHSIVEEKPDSVNQLLIEFLSKAAVS
ncbi:MAG TPA: alpha/beta hydrolase [Steroidobacteraceae bacterium]|nr:alpha/beta hydrolase [Steroidobacteraceae bacterium]